MSAPTPEPSWMKKKIPMPRLFGRGIVWREIRAAIPAVLAMAGTFSLLGLFAMIYAKTNGLPADSLGGTLPGFAIVMSLLLGTLCGAEEEENGTANFVFRLPIPRRRIFAEKLCGSMIAFLLWTALSLFLFYAIEKAFGRNPMGVLHLICRDGNKLQNLAAWGPLLYCFGLAAGAWIGKVVLAALAGGFGAMVFSWLISYQANHRHFMMLQLIDYCWWAVILLACLLALAIAGLRYHLREGR